MENPGEHLVGQYLREILKCDFVECNLQTKEIQGEIDVVGINSSKKEVIICEVATHLETGLQYTKNNQPDNVERFVKKFKKNINYSERNFKGYNKRFMLWTPIVRIPKSERAKHNQLRDLSDIRNVIKKDTGIDIETIFNEKYLECIQELRQVARKTTQALTSPIMRFIQIEEKLNKMKEKSENKIKLEQFWNGYCPESELKGKKVKMRLNSFDFYESEETGLQICINALGVQAVILNFRGTGQFRVSESYADDVVVSEFLSPQNIESFPFNEPTVIFKDSKETEEYIKSIK